MGNGQVQPLSKTPQEMKVESRRRKENIASVENFVTNVYASGARIPSLRFMLSTEMGRRAFDQFIIGTENSNDYVLYCAVRDILTGNFCSEDLSAQVNAIIDRHIRLDCIQPVVLSARMKDTLLEHDNTDPSKPEYPKIVFMVLEALENEVLYTIAAAQLPRYLGSRHYRNWRAAEASHAIAQSVEEHHEVEAVVSRAKAKVWEYSDRSDTDSERSTEAVHTASSTNDTLNSEELAFSAVNGVDPAERRRILDTEAWFLALIAAAEGLPIGFQICSARRRGFPIIYANRYFEMITGYNRQYLHGKKGTILQCPSTEPDSIRTLGEAARLAVCGQTVITNRTCEGHITKVLMAIKPIFNDKGEYVYNLGLHIDVDEQPDGYDEKLDVVEALMAMLPSTVVECDWV